MDQKRVNAQIAAATCTARTKNAALMASPSDQVLVIVVNLTLVVRENADLASVVDQTNVLVPTSAAKRRNAVTAAEEPAVKVIKRHASKGNASRRRPLRYRVRTLLLHPPRQPRSHRNANRLKNVNVA